MVLPKIELELNYTKNESTKVSPIEVVLGYNQHAPLDLIRLPHNDQKHKKVKDLVQDLNVIHAQVKINLIHAYAKYKNYVNKHGHFRSFEVTYVRTVTPTANTTS